MALMAKRLLKLSAEVGGPTQNDRLFDLDNHADFLNKYWEGPSSTVAYSHLFVEKKTNVSPKQGSIADSGQRRSSEQPSGPSKKPRVSKQKTSVSISRVSTVPKNRLEKKIIPSSNKLFLGRLNYTPSQAVIEETNILFSDMHFNARYHIFQAM